MFIQMIEMFKSEKNFLFEKCASQQGERKHNQTYAV